MKVPVHQVRVDRTRAGEQFPEISEVRMGRRCPLTVRELAQQFAWQRNYSTGLLAAKSDRTGFFGDLTAYLTLANSYKKRYSRDGRVKLSVSHALRNANGPDPRRGSPIAPRRVRLPIRHDGHRPAGARFPTPGPPISATTIGAPGCSWRSRISVLGRLTGRHRNLEKSDSIAARHDLGA